MNFTNELEIIPEDTAITIKIKNVANPPPSVASWIKISVTNSNGEYIAYNDAFDSITTLDLAENIIVYGVSASDQHMYQSDVDFTFKYYFSKETVLSEFEEVKVLFPP